MKTSILAVAAALVSLASAHYKNDTAPHVTTTTEVVTAYEFYCPGPTETVYDGVTYTATEATTITITNCPCTVTYPVTISTITSCSTCAPTPGPMYTNATTPIASPTYAPSSSPVSTEGPIFTGAATRAVAGAGAGLAGIFGLAAFVL